MKPCTSKLIQVKWKAFYLAEHSGAKTLGLRDVGWRVVWRLACVRLLVGTQDGGEGVCKFLPRPPGPAPIPAGGPVAHTRGGAAAPRARGGGAGAGHRTINSPHTALPDPGTSWWPRLNKVKIIIIIIIWIFLVPTLGFVRHEVTCHLLAPGCSWLL